MKSRSLAIRTALLIAEDRKEVGREWERHFCWAWFMIGYFAAAAPQKGRP